MPNFKLKYEDSENVKADHVNTVRFNLHQIKCRAFLGTPGIFIPFSQALRIRRICSKETEFDSSGYALKAAFVKRDYSDSEVKEQVNRAKAIIREDTLHSKEKKEIFQDPVCHDI